MLKSHVQILTEISSKPTAYVSEQLKFWRDVRSRKLAWAFAIGICYNGSFSRNAVQCDIKWEGAYTDYQIIAWPVSQQKRHLPKYFKN